MLLEKVTPAFREGAFICALTLILPSLGYAGVPLSKDACQRLSEGAKISQTKALVIAYEGLLSSRPLNANMLASYRDKLAHNERASRPIFDPTGSFLVRGPLVRIVENYKNKVQVLTFGRTGMTNAGSIPATCAEIWMKETGEGAEGRKVIIVGHSFGGGAAWELAHSLQAKGVRVDSVVTADPRSPKQCMGECWSWSKPGNVAVWENFYQSIPLRGHPVPGANNHFMGAVGHMFIQNVPGLYQAIASRIDGVGGPVTTADYQYQGNYSAGSFGGYRDESTIQTSAGRSGFLSGNAASETRKVDRGFKSPFSFFGNLGSWVWAPGGACGPGTKCEKDYFNRSSGNTSGGSVLGQKPEGSRGAFSHLYQGGEPGKFNLANPLSGSLNGADPGLGSSGSQEGMEAGEKPSFPSLNRASATEMMSGLWPLSKGEATAPRASSENSAAALSNELSRSSAANPEELSLFSRVHHRYLILNRKL